MSNKYLQEAYEERCRKAETQVYTATIEEGTKGWTVTVTPPDGVWLRYGKFSTNTRTCATRWGAKRWAKRFVSHERRTRIEELKDERLKRETRKEEKIE